MSLLLDALKKAADDKQKALQLESTSVDVISKSSSVPDQVNDEVDASVSKKTNIAAEELSLQSIEEVQAAKNVDTEELLPENVGNRVRQERAPVSLERNDSHSDSDDGDLTLSDEALSMLIYKTNREVKQGRRILVFGVLIFSLTILVSAGLYYYMDMQEEISLLERKHRIAMQSMRLKTNREKTPTKSEIIRNLVSEADFDEKVQYTKQQLSKEKSNLQPGLAVRQKADLKVQNKSSGTIYHASPEGVSIKDDTSSKSSGTSSGAGMHSLRTKGRNYHASPEGVSIMDDTNNKQQALKTTSANLSIQKTGKTDPVGEKLESAWLAYKSARYDEATKLYKSVLSSEKNNRDALLGLGAIAVIKKEIATAKNIYRTLLELDPRDPIATAALAGLHSNQSSLDADKEYLLSVLQKNPGAHHLNFALGNIFAQQNNWKAAQQYYFNAWQKNNENADYVFNLAVSMDQLSRQQQAIKFYKACLLKSANKQVSFSREAVKKRISELSGF